MMLDLRPIARFEYFWYRRRILGEPVQVTVESAFLNFISLVMNVRLSFEQRQLIRFYDLKVTPFDQIDQRCSLEKI